MKKLTFLMIGLWLMALFITGDGGLAAPAQFGEETPVLAPDTPSLSRALLLDGSADYVEIPHSTALNPTASAFTIEAWVKRDDSARCETIISKGYQTAYWLGFCSSRIRFYASGSGSSADGSTDIPANVWTHIAVVYEGSGRKYYLNGELDYLGGPEIAPTANALPVWIGGDPGTNGYFFDGRISNVRFWNTARSQDEIRRSMHIALNGPLPGLVANWRFGNTDTYLDNIGGFDGTPMGDTTTISENIPAQPAYSPIDTNFNSLPFTISQAAIAYLPDTDQALLMGGYRSGSNSASIDLLDPATGNLTNVGSLPLSLMATTAVYVSTSDSVYLFGGATGNSGATKSDKIYAISPDGTTVTELTTVLPTARINMVAVYHPGLEKVYLFGGEDNTNPRLDTVLVFDPATETISTVGFTLFEPTRFLTGTYSPVTDKIYIFGGEVNSGSVTDYYEVTIDSDGLTGSLANLGPTPDYVGSYATAVEDPITHLIYVIGGYFQDQIQILDPVTEEIWLSPIGTPDMPYASSIIFSPEQRHLMIITSNSVWRVPLGDGPLVPLGYWDFPTSVGAGVTALDGSGPVMAVATNGDGAWRYLSDGSRTHYTPALLGSASGVVNEVSYNASSNSIYLATNDAGAKIIDSGGSITTYNSSIFGTNQINSINANGLYGPNGQGLWRRYFNVISNNYFWTQSFAGQSMDAMAIRSFGDLYVLSGDTLRRLQYSAFSPGGTESNFGAHCGLLSPTDMIIGQNGDWWIVSPGQGEFGGAGICRIPAAATPSAGSTVSPDPALGTLAQAVDMDADGRVWVALNNDSLSNISGGISVFEVNGGATSGVRSADYNWMNAPVGSRSAYNSPPYWNSAITAVGAAEERVWFGKTDGRLITFAQRWQQLDQQNDVGDLAVQNLWTARGRLFLATSNSFHILSPDGLTWENLSTPRVWNVLSDSQGRIWVATNTGIRLYDPTVAGSWDYLVDKEGSRPATAVYALAEDLDGRIWIGGLHGLTLFDRERFVATFDSSNSGLPANAIRTLFVDRQNRLWAGTDVGLALFDGLDWTTYTTADGLVDNRIHDLAQLPNRDLVISTQNGISFFDSTTFSTHNPPISPVDLSLSVDQDGRLWAGNAIFTADTWKIAYTTNSGLASDEISGSTTDHADRIWFSHAPDNGVSVRGTYLPELPNVVPVLDPITTPLSGTAGDEITLTGSGLGYSSFYTQVTLGGAEAQIISVDSNEIVVRITEENTSGDISVNVSGRRVTASNAFCATPTITSFSPTGGNNGVLVQIHGTNFDRAAQVSLGGSPLSYPGRSSPTNIQLLITPEHGTGSVQVVNNCAGQQTVGSEEFRNIGVNLERIMLNQGIPSMGLVARRPTMVQYYLSHSVAPRDTDLIEIGQIELTFTEDGIPHTITVENHRAVPTIDGAPTATDLSEIAHSLTHIVTPEVNGSTPAYFSSVQVQATLKNRSYTVAHGSQTVSFRQNAVVRVLLVPIMPNTYNEAQLREMKANIDRNLLDLRQRMFPTGDMQFIWSAYVFTINDVLITDESQVDLGDTLTLYDASHNLDYARRVYNNTHDPDVMTVYGVVHPLAQDPATNASGKAFWPDIAEMMNAVGLTALDAVCDVGAAVVHFFTLGTVGEGSCDLEVPLYVGWGLGDTGTDRIAHEVGHMFGLVRPYAPNGDLTDNFSHSVYDEIEDGSCGDLSEEGTSAFFLERKSLYSSPGVREPVVNPLINHQYYPQLSDPDGGTDWDHAVVDRGKAVMSYACNRTQQNSFFEPADMVQVFMEYAYAPARFFVDDLTGGLSAASPMETSDIPSPILVAGQRIVVSGQINRDLDTGDLRRVSLIGEDAPLDASFETGYWLVQMDSGYQELSRTGVFPIFASSGEESATDSIENAVGFFAATILADENLASLELRHGDLVLDTFSAGSNTPSVNLSSPGGGSYSSGFIPVTWNATDSDGDSLEISLFYSSDNGVTWTPIGISNEASTTWNLAVSALSGGSNARIRVIASDGLHSAEAISAAFTVANQPPLAVIGAPEDGAIVLEGQLISFHGSASDPKDEFVADSGMRWMSDRDGELGFGTELGVTLSVGTHLITLEATNSIGLSDTASITFTVVGDYDFDGIPDADELADGLNLLTSRDAFSDQDGDGLMLIAERNRGLNPAVADTDNDGRSDGQEVSEGTNPDASDSPLPVDVLAAFPNNLTFDEDLSRDISMPQAQIQLLSRNPVEWTLTADVDWLAAVRADGTTPDSVTIIVNTENLPGDGTYSGNLFFHSSLGTITVPVTATMINVPVLDQEIFLPFISR